MIVFSDLDPPSMMPCEGPPTQGLCDIEWDGYTFDPATGTCEKFSGAGCSMTQNGFKTMEECETRCGKPIFNWFWYISK